MANYANWRAISTSLATQSEKWAKASDAAARLWVHMMLRCDSFGCIDGDAHILWLRCMKRVGWTKPKTIKALNELVDLGLIHTYNVDEYEWAHIVDFDEHQHGEFLRKRGRRMAPQPPCETGGNCARGSIGRRVRRRPQTTENSEQTEVPTGTNLSDQIRAVFDHWVETDVATGGGKASGRILNAKRESLIRARLKEGYSVEQLQQSITGFCHDPWHLGKNNRKTRYTGLVTLLKHGDKVEEGLRKFNEQAARSTTRGEYVRPAAHV